MKTSWPFQLLFLFIVTVLEVADVCAGLRGDASPCVHTGAADGSAAAALDAEHFVAASDEDSVLRVYQRMGGGPPVESIDLARFLGVPATSPETDIEGAARIGQRIYWISSHGRDKEGNVDPARWRFFATEIRAAERGAELLPVGKPYRDLLADLLADKQFQSFTLAAAAKLAPKSPGGLRLEAEVEDVGRKIWGECSTFWEVLMETKSRFLARYGPPPEGLAEYLAPRIDGLIASLRNLTKSLGVETVPSPPESHM